MSRSQEDLDLRDTRVEEEIDTLVRPPGRSRRHQAAGVGLMNAPSMCPAIPTSRESCDDV